MNALDPERALEQAQELYARAGQERANGDAAAAEPLLARALAIVGEVRGQDHPDYAVLLSNLAMLHEEMGRNASAIALFEQGLAVFRARLGNQDMQVADSANSLAQLYAGQEDYSTAKRYSQEALDIYRLNLGEDHLRAIRAQQRLGETYWRTGDYAQAEPLWRENRERIRRVRGGDHPDFATASNDLGMLYRMMGRYAAAEPLLREAIEVYRASPGDNEPGVAQALDNLAGLYEETGNYAASEPLFAQALAIRQAKLGEDHLDVVQSLSNLAELQARRGKYADAEAGYHAALAILRRLHAEQHHYYPAVLGNLAAVLDDLGRYAEAERLMRESIELSQKSPDGGRSLAASFNNLGTHFLRLRNYAAAEPHYLKALELDRAILGEDHPDHAADFANLGVLYHDQGRYADAERLLLQAQSIRRKALGAGHPDVAQGLNALAMLYESQGDYAAAEPCYREALGIMRVAVGEDHPTVATALSNLGGVYTRMGRASEGLQLFLQAEAIRTSTIGHVFGIGSESQRLAYLVMVQSQLDTFLSLVLGHLADNPTAVQAALDVVLRRRAIGTEALLSQRDAVLGGHHPKLATKLRQLGALRGQIGQKTLAGPGPEGVDSHRQLLAEWNAQKESLEVELARQIPEIGMERLLRTASKESVAAALPEDAVLVEIVRCGILDFTALPTAADERWKAPRYLAFVLASRQPEAVRLVDLGDAQGIDRLVAAFRASLTGDLETGAGRQLRPVQESDGAVDGPSDGVALREAIFDPLVMAFGGRRRLLMAPDGGLTRLPFEVLPTNDSRRLIDDYSITYVSVGRDVLRFGSGPTVEPGPPLVVAAPDFDLGWDAAAAPAPATNAAGRRSHDLDRAGLKFGHLPATRREGERIAALLGVRPLLEQEVLEARLKACRSPRVLHLATHGFFLADQPRGPDSGLQVLATSVDARRPKLGRLAAGLESAMLRSGLALAGANTWLAHGALPEEAEDGLLTAEDVVGLDLLGTELAILSACDTGLGQLQVGEGVFGLRRAFALAGARTLIMSLWKVPDQETCELMLKLYEGLLAGRPRADALRDAQLAIKADHPEPRTWGAFICQGYPGPL